MAGIVAATFTYLRARPSRGAAFAAALKLGAFIGILRATLACVGWYGVEHTGGPLQIPAFLLAMFAWPEAWLIGRVLGHTRPEVYVRLAVLLIVSSLVVVTTIAALASAARSRPVALGAHLEQNLDRLEAELPRWFDTDRRTATESHAHASGRSATSVPLLDAGIRRHAVLRERGAP